MTRYGVMAIVAGLLALAVGRVFGVIELYIIGTAFLAAVALASLFVLARLPRVVGARRIRPTTLVAGDPGHVDLHLEHRGVVRSTRFGLHERIARRRVGERSADLAVEPMPANSSSVAGYRLPTQSRGIVELGPLVAEVRDPLGLISRTRQVAGVHQVVVAPRTLTLPMPDLGSGPLGRHLLGQARRLGPGDFHSLREYADGDEPRTIHWRASARTDKLLVKQHTTEGLRRATIVLDLDEASYVDGASFERAVTVAASLVHSADLDGLVTRFVCRPVDLRGPDVVPESLRVLARVDLDGSSAPALDRQPGEGVGLVIVVGGTSDGQAMRAASEIVDPTLTVVTVTTDETLRGPISAAARTEAEFLATWGSLVGRQVATRGA
ncbi:MAG: DUF58 domain-containing protein [Ilumatobacter sp.]